MAVLDDFFATCPSALFVAEADGTLVQRSRAFERQLGEAPSLASLIADDERERFAAFLRGLPNTEADGDPTSAEFRTSDAWLRCEARRSQTGAIHGRLELATTRPSLIQVERASLRHIIDNFDYVLWVVDPDGVFVLHDGKAVRSSGNEPGQFLGMDIRSIYPPELLAPVDAALAGDSTRYTSEFHGRHWETWNFPVLDDAGAAAYCVGLSVDVSARVQAQQEVEHQLQTIQRQQRAIHELATPLIQVWDHILAVPLIGHMDGERSEVLTERLLAEVQRLAVRFTILDLTGVEILDTSIASNLLRLLASLRLLGVEGLITGITPDVAQTLVGLGVDLGSVRTHRTLRDALRACMRELMSE